MKNNTSIKVIQTTMFESIYSDSIRRVIHEDVEYFSVIDIMAEFTDLKTRPDILWRRTKKRLEKDGFAVGSSVIKLKLESSDGKKYSTEVTDGQTVLRIIQSIPSKEAESLRQWFAHLGYRALQEMANPELAVQRRRKELAKLENAGYGEHPETIRLRDRDMNIEVFKSLKHSIAKVCENPHWGAIINAEYSALFGAIKSELETMLQSKSVRENLPSVQLTALTFAERTLQASLARYEHMSNEQVIALIETVVRPIGEMLRTISESQGVHHVTGRSLLDK